MIYGFNMLDCPSVFSLFISQFSLPSFDKCMTLGILHLLWFRWPFSPWSVQVVWLDSYSHHWPQNCNQDHERSMATYYFPFWFKPLLYFRIDSLNFHKTGCWRFCFWECCVFRVKDNSEGTCMSYLGSGLMCHFLFMPIHTVEFWLMKVFLGFMLSREMML